jgi:hypothetical protein
MGLSFGDEKPRESQIRWLREQIYDSMPEEMIQLLPEKIQRKYKSYENSAMMAAQKEKKENLFLV